MPPLKEMLGQRPASWSGFASDPAADSTDSPLNARGKRRNRDSVASTDTAVSENIPPTFRRITGYHNTWEQGGPPDYDSDSDVASIASIRTAPPAPALRTFFDEDPPDYTSSIDAEAVIGMKTERVTPFDEVERPFWSEVHIILRGTLLEIRRVKSPGMFTHYMKRPRKEKSPLGRLLRSYTLQHAEVGLAADHKKMELVPKNLAQLLGPASLKELQETDPDQFDVVYNYVLRLRLEGEQILFRFPTSEQRAEWLQLFCAAVDIAPPLDERGEPKYQTLPRRRRRNGRPESGVSCTSSVDPQERNVRESGSHLSAISEDHPMSGGPHSEFETSHLDTQDVDGHPSDPDAEDLDTTFMVASDTHTSRNRHSDLSAFPIPEEPPDPDDPFEFQHFNTSSSPGGDSKWNPGIEVDPNREARYRRRCMPNLVYNSRHAHDIIVRDGKKVIIDWDERKLKPVQSAPPALQSDAESEPPLYVPPKPMHNSSPSATSSRPASRHQTPRPPPHSRPQSQRIRAPRPESLEYRTAEEWVQPPAQQPRSRAPTTPSVASTRYTAGNKSDFTADDRSTKTAGRSWKKELAALFTFRILRRRKNRGAASRDEKYADERLGRRAATAPARKRSQSVMELTRQVPAARTHNGVYGRRYGVTA